MSSDAVETRLADLEARVTYLESDPQVIRRKQMEKMRADAATRRAQPQPAKSAPLPSPGIPVHPKQAPVTAKPVKPGHTKN